MNECPYKVGDTFDLGNGVELTMTGQYGMEGVFGGVLSHPHPKGSESCIGSVHWDVPGAKHTPKWQVHSWAPLHFEPSFACHCGFHGFIRGGKWVAA